MTPGQFHLEAELADRIATSRNDLRLSDQATEAGIVSLLISVSTRGWLSDSEKQLLDTLVPSHCISFLMFDGEYLHPESVPLLNSDQLEASYLHDNAVYSHRQRLVSGSFTSSRVHAIRLGELNGRPLTFGMIGRDYDDPFDRTADDFSMLTGRFRSAVARVQEVAKRLATHLNAESPALVINRCSGRIVAANGAFCVICSADCNELVKSEFSRAMQSFGDLLAGHLLHAENIRVDDIDLSLVTFRPKEMKANDLAGSMYPRFIESLRRATQALHSTAHHLEGIINWQPGHPETELLRLIQEETTELEQVVHRYQLLTVFDSLRRERINPAEELRQTVTHAAIHHPSRHLTMTEQWATKIELAVPPEALAVLYETILEIHLTSSGFATATSVNFDVDDEQRLTVRFETTSTHTTNHLHCATEWGEYVESLGRLLGFSVYHCAGNGSKLETILTHHKDK